MSGPIPPSQLELQALLEEKNRLLKRLQEKQLVNSGARVHIKPVQTKPSQQEKREQGFNVYLSGANEERVAEQRKRESIKKDVGPRTKTWVKPSPAAVSSTSTATSSSSVPSSNPNSSRSTISMDEPSHGENVNDDNTGHTIQPSQSSQQPKPKRKQWNVGPVALKGADSIVQPPSAYFHEQATDQVEDELNQAPAEQEDDIAQQHTPVEDELEEASLEVEAEPQYEEDFDPLSPQKPAPAKLSLVTDSSSNQQRRPPMNAAALRESIQEDITNLRERLAQQHDDDGMNEVIEETEEEQSLPLSPPPLALRKKDVSVLRESLEIFSKAKQPDFVESEDQPPLRQSAQRYQDHHHHIIPPIQTFSNMDQDPLYNNDITPFPTKDSQRDTVSSGALTTLPFPTAPGSLPPAPTTSSSPTLPTRSLTSSSRRTGTAAATTTITQIGTEPSASGTGATTISTTTGDPIGPYTNLRTSVSFDDEAIEEERPSTPQNTDSVSDQNNSTLRTSLILSQSFDKESVETLLLRFRSLPKHKRSKLLAVLSDLECGDASDIPSELKESLEMISDATTHKQQQQSTLSQTKGLDSTTKQQSTSSTQSKPTASVPPIPAAAEDAAKTKKEVKDVSTATTAASSSTISSAEATPANPSPIPVPASKLSLLKQKQQFSSTGSATATAALPPVSISPPPHANDTTPPTPADSQSGGDELVVASFAPPPPSLTIRVLSHHGHLTSIGLTQIELYDRSGNKLRIPPSSLHFNWTSGHPSPGPIRGDITKVISGKNPRVTDEKIMWTMPIEREQTFPIDSNGKQHGFELQFYLPSFFAQPAKLLIWNYNRSLMDSSRGVRKVEILVQGKSVFQGEVTKAPGEEGVEYAYKIPLIPGMKIEEEEDRPIIKPSISALPIGSLSASTHISSTTSATVSRESPLPNSSRPLWLQGSSPVFEPTSSSIKDVPPQPPIAQQPAPAPTLGHSASAAVLGSSAVNRRRTNPNNANSLLNANANLRENLQTAQTESTQQTASTSGSVPPLLPAAGWSGDSNEQQPQPAVLKRPMSGRRAVAQVVGSASATIPNLSSTSSTLPPSDSSKRAPSAGRRRPSIPDNSSTSVSPAPSVPTLEQEVSEPVLPSTVDSSSAAAQVKRRSELESSWDSLEHFKHNHHGRLPPAAAPANEVATSASTKTLTGSKSAAVLPSTVTSQTATTANHDDTILTQPPPPHRHTRSYSDDEPLPGNEEKQMEALPSAASSAANNTISSSLGFSIPTLPSGRRLTFELLSTYGDPYYIGLSGVEIFDQRGQLVTFADRRKSIHASPSSVNILPGSDGNDPRVVTNLLDGYNATCDDFHLWLCPFSSGKRHVIVIDFDAMTTISFIRIWNYNKSRIHSSRGVKDLRLFLDQQLIFTGPISQAPGNVEQAASRSENILFTTEPQLLARIASHLQQMSVVGEEKEPSEKDVLEFEIDRPQRPSTAGGAENDSKNDAGEQDGHVNVHTSVDFTLLRPKTSAVPTLAPPSQVESKAPSESISTMVTTKSKSSSSSYPTLTGQEICLHLVQTWGDAYFVGLTGIQVLDGNLQPIPLTVANLDAYPRDINSVPGHSGDNRTLDKLVNGDNVTCNDNNMWLAPVLQPEDISMSKKSNPNAKYGEQWLRIRLNSVASISALRIWNYNKSDEDTYRGIRSARVTVDRQLVSPPSGFLFRKACGNTDFDFGQTIFLTGGDKSVEQIPMSMKKMVDYTMPILPCGFLLKFLFLSTWGDCHYIGLNGLEIYDHHARKVPIHMQHVCAVPSSLNELHPDSHDTRTLDKLFDGINDTYDDRHMWLTPLLPSATPAGQPRNIMYIYFDAPVAIAAMKFWNYSKTPSRGVQALQILLDDVIIYDGVLKQAPPPTPSLATSFAQSLLFCAHPTLLEQESSHLYRDSSEQDVLLVDERRFMNQPSALAAPTIPRGQTHQQVVQATTQAAGKSATGPNRPKTMARGQ